jgi:hypothetical protein
MQIEFGLEAKELNVELGGYFISDLHELATGEWDVYTQPYIKNYRFIGFSPIFNDKVIVKSREFTYKKRLFNVSYVFEKIVFVIPSVPTDATFSFELEHNISRNGYWNSQMGDDYDYASISCRVTFKARDTALCKFEIEAEDDELRKAVESICPIEN